jgi:tetratricopeptide (TPR) repeat protein
MKHFCPVWVLALLVMAFPAFSLDYFAEGERLFRENRPSEAIPLLFQASQAAGTDSRVYNYLGLCYMQTGKYPDAISAFMKGTSATGADRKVLFCNAGHVYFLQGLFAEAETMYTSAVGIDPAYAPALLNRGNVRVNLKNFAGAIDDYNQYLVLDPATWQGDSIRKLIALLTEEKKSAQEAELRAQAEKATAEAETKAANERYKKLLDEVSASLQSVDDASTRSAGSEGIMDYDEEGQLE